MPSSFAPVKSTTFTFWHELNGAAQAVHAVLKGLGSCAACVLQDAWF